jgi:dTDP-L-rhamnose 4-epimerase
VQVLEDPRADYQVFNVGGGTATSVLQYGALVAQVLGADPDVAVPGEYRFGDTRHIISDISRLRGLGWEPSTPLPQIIAEYAAWAREQSDLGDPYAQAEQVMKQLGTVRTAGAA